MNQFTFLHLMEVRQRSEALIKMAEQNRLLELARKENRPGTQPNSKIMASLRRLLAGIGTKLERRDTDQTTSIANPDGCTS